MSTQEFEASRLLPTIAQQYCEKREAPAKEEILAPAKDGRSSTRIDAQILRCIAKEIRVILLACNRVSGTRTRSHGHHPREEARGKSKEIEESKDVRVSPPKRQRLLSILTHNLVLPSRARQAFECPYPSSLFPATTFVSKLRHGSDQCTQTKTDGISMADMLLPRSTLRNSIAGFLFVFCFFSRRRKRTQKQELQQHAEGSLETDVII